MAAQEQLSHVGEAGKGPTAGHVAAVAALLPVGGTLLGLSGVTFAATVAGLAAAAPLFLIFSPVLVPAAAVIGIAVMGFLAAGAFSLTALSSLTWLVSCLRGAKERAPELVEHAKRRVQEAAGHVEARGKEAGQRLQGRPQEGGAART
ncbi:oleosin 18 kDa-like [Wolffia australiana]